MEFLSGCASVGNARSRNEVIQLAQEVVLTVTHGWWDSFRRRDKFTVDICDRICNKGPI